jgi:hypothetical protein
MTTQTIGQIIGWILFSYFTLILLWDIQAWYATSKLYRKMPLKQAITMLKLVLRSRIGYYLWLPIVPVIYLVYNISIGSTYPLIFIISIFPLWLHLVIYQALPPSVVVLGTSRHEMFDMRHWLERAVNPYRVVVLLEPASTVDKQDTVFRKNQFNWDNLRTSDGHWRDTAFRLIEMSPTLVIDARVHTMGVAEEILRISNSNLIHKALFVENEDQTAPAINESGVKYHKTELQIVKVAEIVPKLKKMGLTKTTSPDDAFLTANASFNYHSKKLEKQMRTISKTGIPVLNAFKTAERSHGQTTFIIETQHLLLKLNGNPGDGALEVLKNLKSDIAMLNAFIEKWSETTVYEYLNVVKAIEAVHNELKKLQIIVDQAPPVFLERNEQRLREMFGKS